MVNIYMKKCLTCLAIREIQMKSTLRIHCQNGNHQETNNNKFDKDVVGEKKP
jgi:hypothetical protein